MLDQLKAPLLQALKELAHKPHAPFYAPGHKRGQGIPQPSPICWGRLCFWRICQNYPTWINLFAPEGVIKEAQALAAEAFGADQTWFLVNGSTAE
jgi:arginine decarboxylase